MTEQVKTGSIKEELYLYKNFRDKIRQYIKNEIPIETVFEIYYKYETLSIKNTLVNQIYITELSAILKKSVKNCINQLFDIFINIQNDYFKIPIMFLSGLGPKRVEYLRDNYNILTLKDLLFYFPKYYFFADKISKIKELKNDVMSVVAGEIKSIKYNKRFGRKPARLEALLSDGTGAIKIVWFNAHQGLFSSVKQNNYLLAAGKVKYFNGRQIVPVFFSFEKHDLDSSFLIKKYNIQKFGDKLFAKIINEAIAYLENFYIEIIPDYLLSSRNISSFTVAIKQGHLPSNDAERLIAKKRFIYEEFLYFQTALQYKKYKHGFILKTFDYDKKVLLEIEKFIRNLKFKLTKDQLNAIEDIKNDIFSSKKMSRLLQGDVGSGKTIVAAAAILIALLNGYQAAVMAPTGILANQHYLTFCELFKNYDNINIESLTGNTRQSEKQRIYSDLKFGKINLIIGTHALFQEKVDFNNIKLIVIDEQHRFGVNQREKLITKGFTPDVLFLSATPIPRTLAISYYGDMDTSLILQKPAGRKEVRTYVRKEEDKENIFKFIKDKICNYNYQVFIICPLISESDKLDLKSAESYYEDLKTNYFKEYRVGLLHGKTDKKDLLIEKFKNREIDILVSTTVIEVGLDVPDANIIIIENAERFGLSQLHQLRGRVGRDNKESYCILIVQDKITHIAEKRMKTLEKYSDGFKISEIDLLLRGTGDILGIKQSGFVDFKFGNIVKNSKELLEAYNDAKLLLKNHNGYKENKIIEISEKKYGKKIEKILY